MSLCFNLRHFEDVPHHEICQHYGSLFLVTRFNIVCLFRDYLVIVTPVSVLIQDLCREGDLLTVLLGANICITTVRHTGAVIHSHVPPGTQQLPTPENIQWIVFSVSVVLKSL